MPIPVFAWCAPRVLIARGSPHPIPESVRKLPVHTDTRPIPHTDPPALSPLRSSPQMAPCMVPAGPFAPCPPQGWQRPGKRRSLAVVSGDHRACGEGSRKATVPGSTYQPGPHSPTRPRGVRATGGRGRAEDAGETGRGDTDKNHWSLRHTSH